MYDGISHGQKAFSIGPDPIFFSFSRGGRSGDTSTSFFKVTYMSTIQISKLSPLRAAVKSFELFSDWLNSKRCFFWVEMCCLYFVIRWKKGGPTWQKSVLCTMSKKSTKMSHFYQNMSKLALPNSPNSFSGIYYCRKKLGALGFDYDYPTQPTTPLATLLDHLT